MNNHKKKDRYYIPILDQPIEELKKPMDNPIDFGKIIETVLSYQKPKIGKRHKKK